MRAAAPPQRRPLGASEAADSVVPGLSHLGTAATKRPMSA